MSTEAHRLQLAEARSHIRHVGRPMADRLWEKVTRGDNCWEWRGTINANGYGIMRSGAGGGRVLTHLAHRVAYELAHGPIPKGALICHTCDNRGCVRPEHLYAGSAGDNSHDRDSRGRNGKAKVTAAQVVELRQRRANGELLAVLAADYGLSVSQTCSIAKGRDWKAA